MKSLWLSLVLILMSGQLALAQQSHEWEAEPRGHIAAPPPDPLLAQWYGWDRRFSITGDTRAADVRDNLVDQLKARNWCHAFPTSTNWYQCDRPLPNETSATSQYSSTEREGQIQSFMLAAQDTVQMALNSGLDAWQLGEQSNFFEPCRDPKSEGYTCALTIAQRRDLYSQVVNFNQSRIPHYTLHR